MTTNQTHDDPLALPADMRQKIAALADLAVARGSDLTDARPADPAKRGAYQDLLDRSSATRGRGLLYPFIGSGRGKGALVELADGSVKWDMISGIGVHFLGHQHPEVTRAALEGALADALQDGNLQSSFAAYEFAETLLGFASRGSRLRHCYSSTSGAMANENALKVCLQKHAPACRVLAFAGCFMGRSIIMSQIGDSPGNRVGIPLNFHVDYMPFYDPAIAARMGQQRYTDMAVMHLRQYIKRYPGQHACFIFELVQGEGGFNTAPREFFAALMDVCKDHGIAVWDDEIQTFGRTGSMFAYDALDLGEYVDVFCVGKMTQVCATLFTPEYNPHPGLLSGTFTGSVSNFKAGTAILEHLDSNNLYGGNGRIARHHALFVEQVRALVAKHSAWFPPVEGIEHWGGAGGMMRFTPFGGKRDAVVAACRAIFDEGAVVFFCGHDPYHVRMLPPIPAMDEDDWPKVFACVERGLSRVATHPEISRG